MPTNRSDVMKIAELAKLHFDESEIDAFTSQFQRILDYMEKLKEVDVEGIEPTSHVSAAEAPEIQPIREDEVRQSLPTEDALANAPDPGDDYFRVPKVL